MPDINEVVEVGMDASDFKAGVEIVAEALKQYNINVDRASDATARFDKRGRLLSATIKQMAEDGVLIQRNFAQVTKTLKELDAATGKPKKVKVFEEVGQNFATSNQKNAELEKAKALREQLNFGSRINEVENAHIKALQEDIKLTERKALLQQRILGAQQNQLENDRIAAIRQDNDFNKKRTRAANALNTTQSLTQVVQPGFSIGPNADPSKVVALNSALGGFNKALIASGLSASQTSQIIQNTLNKQITDLTLKNPEVVAALGRTQKAMSAFSTQAGATGNQVGFLSNAFSTLSSRVGSILISVGILETIQAIRQAVTDSNEFSKQLAEIGTISQGTGVSLGEFRAGIIDISNTFGLARKDVAEGVYQTLSNQIGNATDAIKFNAEAAKFGKAAVASQTDSVNLLSSALNSFGLNVNNTEAVSASFFKTIELGRLRAGDLANTYGTVGVAANQLGVSYNEVNAALAQLTISGVTAANAQTFLRNFLVAMIKPSEALKEVFDKYGFATGQAAFQSLGFEGVLRLLSKETEGNVSKFGELTQNIRSLQVSLGLAADGGSKYAKTLKEISGGLGNFKNAADLVQQDISTKFNQVFVVLNNQFLSFGDAVRKAVVSILDAFGGIERGINVFKNAMIAGLVGGVAIALPALGALGSALPALTAKVIAFNTALLANPFTLVATAVGVAVFSVKTFFDNLQAVDEEIKKISTTAQEELARVEQLNNTSINDFANKQTQIIGQSISELIAKYNQLEVAATSAYKRILQSGVELGQSLVQSQNRVIRNLENENAKSDKVIQLAKERTERDILKIKNAQFETTQKDSTFQLQLSERILERERLIQQAKRLSAEGNSEGAIQSLDLAAKQTEKISDLSTKIKSLSKDFNSFIRDSVKSSFDLQERIIDLSFAKIGKTFDKVKKSLKDITDRTGDRTGISSAFLKGFVAELNIASARTDSAAGRLIRNLDRMQKRGKATILDPQTQGLIDRLDTNTIKELKFRVRIGDTESVTKILDQVKEKLALENEDRKINITNNKANFLEQEAFAAKQRNDFEAERKFLEEARDLRASVVSDPGQAQQDFLRSTQLLAESFKNQLTAKGKIKEQEDTMFRLAQLQVELQLDSNEILVERERILEGIRKKEEEDKAKRTKEITEQRDNLVNLQNVFKDLKGIKIGPETDIKKATEQFEQVSARFADLFAKSTLDPESFVTLLNAKAQIVDQFEQQRSAIQAIRDARDAKTKLDLARQTVDQEKKIRSDALDEVQGRITQLTQQSAIATENVQKAQQALNTATRTFNPFTGQQTPVDTNLEANLQKATKQQEETKKALANLKDIRILLRAVQADKDIDPIVMTPEKAALIKSVFDTIKTGGLTDETRERVKNNFDQIFTPAIQRTKDLLGGFKDFKDEATGLIKITFEDGPAFDQLNALEERIKQMKTNIEINVRPRLNAGGDDGDEPEGFAFGGLVGGKGGIDANIIRATRGEMVINPQATSRNLTLLREINAGKQPAAISQSRTVTMGNISINVDGSANPEMTARTVLKEIRKLQKRGL